MSSRFSLDAKSADFPDTDFANLLKVNGELVLSYEAATAKRADWGFIAPADLTGALTVDIFYKMATATTGGVAFDVAVEAVTPGDALDTNTTSGFATTNTGTDSVPGAAGHLDKVTITLTNDDGIAAGDKVRLSVTRAVANAADDATGLCYVTKVRFSDAA
jgi:hypothetical protein